MKGISNSITLPRRNARLKCHAPIDLPLAAWPLQRPADGLQWVNELQSAREIESLRESVAKGRPFGDPQWSEKIARRLNLQSSFRKTGRPKKKVKT
jgi:putative transposase